ncbi:MAG: metallopeptidase family protein [Patescibacteria group bacterium]
MEADEFEQIVVEEWANIPQHFTRRIENVALLIEDEPNDAVREEEGLEDGHTLLGLYRGIPLTERGEGYGVGETLPDTITLYRFPILDESLALDQSPSDAVRTIIRETLWHEVGHYFGLGEEAVEKREEEETSRFEI